LFKRRKEFGFVHWSIGGLRTKVDFAFISNLLNIGGLGKPKTPSLPVSQHMYSQEPLQFATICHLKLLLEAFNSPVHQRLVLLPVSKDDIINVVKYYRPTTYSYTWLLWY
jgi:hypothetical protein